MNDGIEDESRESEDNDLDEIRQLDRQPIKQMIFSTLEFQTQPQNSVSKPIQEDSPCKCLVNSAAKRYLLVVLQVHEDQYDALSPVLPIDGV